MLDPLVGVNEQARGLRGLADARPLAVVTVVGGRAGAGASLVAAGLAHGIGAYGRALVLDEQQGACSLATILGLRVRYDGRSVTQGKLSWSKARVPLENQVDYLSLARLAPSSYGQAEASELYALARQYDLVIVDGAVGKLAQRLAAIGQINVFTLVVMDEAMSSTTWPAIWRPWGGAQGALGFVVNHVRSPAHTVRRQEQMIQWASIRGIELHDFGQLPWAPMVNKPDYFCRTGQLPMLSLPAALEQLQGQVVSWVWTGYHKSSYSVEVAATKAVGVACSA